MELVKTLIYTGEYNQKALTNAKRSCGSKIREMNELIKKEEILLEKVNTINGHDTLKGEVIEHVKNLKQIFQDEKQANIDIIKKQSLKSEGQKKFFEYVKKHILFTELRTTPLVTRNGIIQQKGVDAKFSTDLLMLAQANAFDIAIILTGDADLKECIKLIRERYGKLIFIVAYYSPSNKEKKNNTISADLLDNCDYFINLYELDESDIEKISTEKIPKHNS